MTINAGDIIRGDMFYESPGASTQMNVFYWQKLGDSVTDAAFIAAIANWALNIWGDDWAALADSASRLDRVELKKVTAFGVVITGIGTADINLVGGNLGEVTSAAVSGFIQSDVLNSTLKGRKFVPGVSESNIADGIIIPAATIFLADLLTAWQTNPDFGVVEDVVPILISRVLGVVRILADTGFITDVPAYQRRRKPSVGI